MSWGKFLGAALALLICGPALAQSSPGFVQGQPLTASQLNGAFTQKLDYLSLGNAATRNVGDLTGTVTAGDDARLGASVNVKNIGAKADGGVTDNCPYFTTALASGKNVYVPRATNTYVLKDCYLTMNSDGQSIYGDGHSSWMIFSYTGTPTGPAIYIGNTGATPTRVNNVSFRSVRMNGSMGQYLIWDRYARGVRFFGTLMAADGLLRLGDASLATACSGSPCSSYIVEMYDGNEFHQLGTSSPANPPTLHFVLAENFLGQWVSQNTFTEGAQTTLPTAGIDGFHAAGNLVDLEHGIVEGGYWSRFDVNWNFYKARTVGWFFSHHFSELGLTSAFIFGADGTAVREGCNNVVIADSLASAIGDAIVFRVAGASRTCERIELHHIFSPASTVNSGSAIFIDAAAGTTQQVIIDHIDGALNAGVAQDFVHIKGSSSATLTNVLVGNLNGTSTSANVLNAILHVEGTGNVRVQQTGPLVGTNVGAIMDDDSGVVRRAPSSTRFVRAAGLTFGAIAAGAQSSQTITLTGVIAAQSTVVGNLNGALPAGAVFSFNVTADNTVTVTCSNISTGTITPGALAFNLYGQVFN